MARKKQQSPFESKTQHQPKRLRTVRAFNKMLDHYQVPIPWRDGITTDEFEFLKSRGVQPEALFKEFFGHWREREKLTPTERGHWRAAVALVLSRIASDSIIKRDQFKAHQRHVIELVRSIPRPPRPELAKPSDMPETFRGRSHLRMLRDASGREVMEMSFFAPDGPLFPQPGASAGPSTIENIGSSDQRGVAEFFVLLGPEHFSTYLAELVEALATGSDPGAFWAKWIDVVVERTPPETDEPKNTP